MFPIASDVKSNAPAPWRSRILGLAATFVAGLLTACGGSGSSSSAPQVSADNGSALITLQDVAGDFLSYTVNVVSLKLTKASGADVETLPATARVDFAQLVDLSELVSAGQIPTGEYVGATLTLDYSSASITAEGTSGESVALTPQDTNGNALTGSLDLAVQFDNRHHLIVTPGRNARLALDFNLAASNMVDLATASVKVSPLIQATVVPPAELAIRVRGTLVASDPAGHSYTVNVHPFHLELSTAAQFVVHTTSTTHFEIDGDTYTGDAGLTALTKEPANTVTLAFGTLTTSDYSFTATRVLAGSSAESSNADRVRGDVIARSGDTLTVRGATLDRRDGSFEFMRGDVTVSVATTTKVTTEGQMGTSDTAAISVGQNIWAAGTVSIDSATGTATLDATTGHVRLNITPLWGMTSGTVGNPLILGLGAIDGRNPAIYNFSGTGASPATDANSAAYAIDTGTLDLTGLSANAPVRLFGFPVPFGSAVNTDFRAETIVTYNDVHNQMVVGWTSVGSVAAFPGLSSSSTALNLNLDGVGSMHYLQSGPERLDLLSLTSAPQIIADSTATFTEYAIGHAKSRRAESYQSFGDFISALAGNLSGATPVLGLAGNGRYDAVSDTFAASQLAVLLND